MLSGDNGLLTRTTDAKERTGISEIVENAKLDVLAQIAENKGENISKGQLKSILNTYFDDIDNLELPDDLSNSDIKLNANQTYGGYKNIALSEIYNGVFSLTDVTNEVPDITKNKWKLKNGDFESYNEFNKNGNIYTDGESEPIATYFLKGRELTVVFDSESVTLEWDGEKFVTTLDNGEGGSFTITYTEITDLMYLQSILEGENLWNPSFATATEEGLTLYNGITLTLVSDSNGAGYTIYSYNSNNYKIKYVLDSKDDQYTGVVEAIEEYQ